MTGNDTMNQPSGRRPLLPRLAGAGRTFLLATTAVLALVTASMPDAQAMDTDIFGAASSSAAAPNVLIILDNTASWNDNSQHFEVGSGVKQGQAEVDAIRQAISALPGNINVGLMEYPTGSGKDTGGFIRFAVSPVGSNQGSAATTNRTNFSNTLNSIFNNLAGDQTGSSMAYGDLMYDAYNYFSSFPPFAASSAVAPSLADSNGYFTNYTKFKSPLSDATSCATTYIIFIANTPAKGPSPDSALNLSNLKSLDSSYKSQLPLPNFTSTQQSPVTELNSWSACFASAPTSTPTDPQCSSYDSCAYSASYTRADLDACPAGSGSRFNVVQSTPASTTWSQPQPQPATQNPWTTAACSASVPTAAQISADANNPQNNSPCGATTVSADGLTRTSYACTNGAASNPKIGSCKVVNGNGNGQQQTYQWSVTQTITPSKSTATTTPASNTTLGNTQSCYASASSCSWSDYSCAPGSTCSCTTPISGNGLCPAGTLRYEAVGTTVMNIETPTNPPTYTTDTNTFNADEWARFLHGTGVPVGTSGSRQTVSTYTIDVYRDKPNATQSSLLSSMARAGGGKYFTATNESAILSALTSIFSEIQAVNDTFSSAALPISATNRAQNSNQVYIGMFRPDQGDHPRWFGNLKRYQVANLSGFSGLAGSDGKGAVSATTGFVTPCAVSWWTTDSGSYWYDTNNNAARIFITQAATTGSGWTTAGDDSNFAKGTCGNLFPYSDLPDGPTVEKGAAAEKLRTQASRNLYTAPAITVSNPALTTFDASTTGISTNSTVNANVAKFILGQDVTGEIGGVPSTAARPSIHGEVIHSRPLPVDYGGTTGVVIYYGAGDGVYHAVSGTTGEELWGFVAPEMYPQLRRLMDNTPLVQTPFPATPGTTKLNGTWPKDFFFDGSTGVYQNADNTKVWIYPAMRRGGRMLYGLNVTTPTTPTLKWRAGCPDLTDDNNCTSGMSGIGQTWSTPQVAKVNGYKVSGTSAPVVIVGGGYDGCEDDDTATPSCSNPKGAHVYVLDANTGTPLATFDTARSVVADVALVDTNSDGIADAAYAADLGGNLYRVEFPSTASGPSDWKMTKVAYTNVTPSNKYRKFEFAPAVLPYNGKVYVALVSGDREHPLAASYPYTTPVVNRAYVYLDDPGRTTATDLDGALMQDNTATAATCDTDKVLPGSSKVGWHLDLNAYGKGEQGVTSAIIIGGMVSFSTNRPVVSGQTCTTSLGEARGYWLNLLNGSGAIGVSGTCGGDLSQTFVGGGLPPSPVAATVNVDGSQQTIVIGATCRDGSNCSPIQAQQVRPPISNKRRRTYWRTNSGDNH